MTALLDLPNGIVSLRKEVFAAFFGYLPEDMSEAIIFDKGYKKNNEVKSSIRRDMAEIKDDLYLFDDFYKDLKDMLLID